MAIPSAPMGLGADFTYHPGVMTVTAEAYWHADSTVDYYEVSDSLTSNWTRVNGNTVEILSIPPASQWTLMVRGVNSDGTGPQTDRTFTTPGPDLSPPDAPTHLRWSHTTNSVLVSWNQPSGTVTDYEVRIDGGTWVRVGEGAAGTSYTFIGLDESTDYTVDVRALNGDTAGDSTSVMVTTSDPLPAAPILTVAKLTTDSITITFSANTAGGSVTVWHVRIDGGQYVNVNTSPYTFTGLTVNTQYLIEVRGNNAAGNGPDRQLRVTTKPPATAPTATEPAIATIEPDIYASMHNINPVHMLREVLTNDTFWGFGIRESRLHNPSFTLAAETCFAEKLGCSFEVTGRTKAVALFKMLRTYISCEVFYAPSIDQIKIKLIRDDYDEDEIPALNKTNVQLFSAYQVNYNAKAVSVLTLKYKNWAGDDQSVSLTAPNFSKQSVTQTITYDCCPDERTALRVASRDLAIANNSPLTFVATVDCELGASLEVGDAVRVSWPDRGINNLVMRIINQVIRPDRLIDLKLMQELFIPLTTVLSVEQPRIARPASRGGWGSNWGGAWGL